MLVGLDGLIWLVSTQPRTMCELQLVKVKHLFSLCVMALRKSLSSYRKIKSSRNDENKTRNTPSPGLPLQAAVPPTVSFPLALVHVC